MKIMDTIYKEVSHAGGCGYIYLPKSLIGEEVKISFIRKLTEKEIESIRLHNAKLKLEKMKGGKKWQKKT